MANPLIALIGAVMFAGVVLVGCNQDSASVEDQTGGMLIGDPATVAGSRLPTQGQELAQVDISSSHPLILKLGPRKNCEHWWVTASFLTPIVLN